MKSLVVAGILILGFCLNIVNTQTMFEENDWQSDDKIYDLKDVDQKAEVLKSPQPKPRTKEGCGYRTWIVRVKVVLLKSGKVGSVEVHNPPNPPNRQSEEELKLAEKCGITKSVLQATKGIKFKPAIKAGQPVSQYAYLMYEVRVSPDYEE